MTDRLQWLVDLPREERALFLNTLTKGEHDDLQFHWGLWARPQQLAPVGNWRIWLMCAGRGFGKTRAGSEWVRQIARQHSDARIALVSASLAEARAVMVEGESGILAICPPTRRPLFEPSLRRLTWDNGAQALLYSAAEAESLRGPQHSHAWCDEIAKWDNSANRAMRSWNNLHMGLRLGDDPRILATTTPRPVPLMEHLLGRERPGDVVVTRGRTYDNAAHLAPAFVRDMRKHYGNTALGRQELDGEMLTEVEGALWSRALLEQCRKAAPKGDLVRIVVGVDPPVSAHGDACGIIVAGVTSEGLGRVLADATLTKASPERWARQVALTAQSWQADRVVAEANQGGAMVESVLRAADCAMPVRLVHASRGKSARAEPVAALYEAGRVHHSALFSELEDQLCGMMAGGTYEGPGRSPDRADALVWALTDLMLHRRASPRVFVI